MAFLVGNIALNVYTDTAQTSFPQYNIPNIAFPFTNNSITAIKPLYVSIAASGSLAVNFTDISGVTQAYLYSDAAALSLTINGTAGFTYKAATPGYIPIALTSLTIANSSSTVATNVTLILISG